ncbi:MAG: type II secretion system F family protein [Acidimicrobiia bacterium]
MTIVLGASLGVVVAGPVGGLVGGLVTLAWDRLARRPDPDPPLTLVLLLLIVELKSGRSVLAALIAVSDTLPDYDDLHKVTRVARVSGLVSSLPHANDELRPVIAQLARAQRSGASLSGSVRRILDTVLAAERSRRIARARTLPVRLMIPVTLLMLPGLVLFLYAPTLLGMFEDLTGVLE